MSAELEEARPNSMEKHRPHIKVGKDAEEEDSCHKEMFGHLFTSVP